MIDTIIVSGGDIQSDFALYFLKKNIEKAGRENIRLIAADRGLEFFLDYLILPDVVIGQPFGGWKKFSGNAKRRYSIRWDAGVEIAKR